MDYSAGYCDTISMETVKKYTPKTWPKLEALYTEDLKSVKSEQRVLDFLSFVWDGSFNDISVFEDIIFQENSSYISDDDETIKSREERYEEVFAELINEFSVNTTIDNHSLCLSMYYHDSSQGSSYDDFHGGVFTVENCYVPSPAADKMIRDGIIVRNFFTIFS